MTLINPDKLQAFVLKNRLKTKVNLIFSNENVSITDAVKLLEIEIHKDPTFNTHVAELWSKVPAQLNAINRLYRYFGKSEKAAIINSFGYANVSYCAPVLHFYWWNSTKKIDKIQKHCLKTLLDDCENDYDALL